MSLFLFHLGLRAKTHIEINNNIEFICNYIMIFFLSQNQELVMRNIHKLLYLITKKIDRFTNGLPIIAVICKGERHTHSSQCLM